jgi:hypothetical protein
MIEDTSISSEGSNLQPIKNIEFTKDALTYGFTSFYKVGGGLWLLAVLYVGIHLFNNKLSVFIESSDSPFLLASIIGLFITLISWIIIISGLQIGLKAYEKGRGNLEDIVEALPQAPKILGAVLVFYLLILTISALAVFLYILVIPLLIYLVCRLFPLFVIILDKKLDALNALNRSFQLTSGNFIPILIFIISCGLISAIGTLLFGLGLLVSFPVTVLATIYAYKQLDLHYEALNR